MPLSKARLFIAPGTCARVSLIALEETGAPIETHPLVSRIRIPQFVAGPEAEGLSFKPTIPEGVGP